MKGVTRPRVISCRRLPAGALPCLPSSHCGWPTLRASSRCCSRLEGKTSLHNAQTPLTSTHKQFCRVSNGGTSGNTNTSLPETYVQFVLTTLTRDTRALPSFPSRAPLGHYRKAAIPAPTAMPGAATMACSAALRLAVEAGWIDVSTEDVTRKCRPRRAAGWRQNITSEFNNSLVWSRSRLSQKCGADGPITIVRAVQVCGVHNMQVPLSPLPPTLPPSRSDV